MFPDGRLQREAINIPSRTTMSFGEHESKKGPFSTPSARDG
jgi:hypothetical protein